MTKWGRGVIHGHAFTAGFLVMALEMLGSRYLTPYFGAGIVIWAALISTVLLALAAGYFAGGWVAGRFPIPWVLAALLLLSAGCFAVIPVLSGPLLEGLFHALPDERIGALAGAAALLSLPLALLGAYSPVAIRLLVRSAAHSGAVAGRIFGLSTLGGIAGTLVTTFVLIPWSGTRAITYGLAALALAGGLSLLPLRAARSGARSAHMPAGLKLLLPLALWGVVGIAAPPVQAAEDDGAPPSLEALRRLPDGLLAERETEYSRVFVRKTGPYLMMLTRLRGQSHAQSIRHLERPQELIAPYTQVLTGALLYVPRPQRLLMLGLGGGTTTRYLQRHLPSLHIDAVELDRGVIELARRYFGVKESARYRIVRRDARVFLRRSTAAYDIIMVDAFLGDRMPFHLLTREFYRLAASRLRPHGVLAVNLIEGTRLYPSVIATLRGEFRAVERYAVRGQVVAMALKGTPTPPKVLRERAVALQGRHGFPHDLAAIAALRRETPPPGDALVLSDDYAPVNALLGYGPRILDQAALLRSIIRQSHPPRR